MIELKITGENVADIIRQLGEVASGTAALPTTLPSANAEPAETTGKRRGRRPNAERQISASPENRQEAETGTEDSAEDQAQDTADEKADSKAQAPEKLTHDHLRGKLGEYVKKFGMAAAQEDGPKLIQNVLKAHKLPTEGKAKISDLPDDQDVLKTALAGVDEMIEKNPFKREVEL